MEISLSEGIGLLLLAAAYLISIVLTAVFVIVLILIVSFRARITIAGLISAFLNGTLRLGLRKLLLISIVASSILMTTIFSFLVRRLLDFEWSVAVTLASGISIGIVIGFLLWKLCLNLIGKAIAHLQRLNPFNKTSRNQNHKRLL